MAAWLLPGDQGFPTPELTGICCILNKINQATRYELTFIPYHSNEFAL
jgi:hypothetical protein